MWFIKCCLKPKEVTNKEEQHPLRPYVVNILEKHGMRCLYQVYDDRNVEIWKVLNTNTNNYMAAKIAKRGHRARLKRESYILESLDHANIVPFLSFICEYDYAILSTEWVSGGDFLACFSDDKFKFEPKTFLVQMIGALQCLWEVHGCAHCDISLENILNQGGRPKLCDFEFANDLPVLCGKLPYQAPEMVHSVLVKKNYCVKSCDVYALGVCYFAMLFGIMPLPSIKSRAFEYVCDNGWPSLFSSYNINISADDVQLISGMLAIDPCERWTYEDVLRSVS
jgi:serine/threonine protein kinase